LIKRKPFAYTSIFPRKDHPKNQGKLGLVPVEFATLVFFERNLTGRQTRLRTRLRPGKLHANRHRKELKTFSGK
jgi:hypothetical protein